MLVKFTDQVQDSAERVELDVDCAKWERALVTYHATGAPGSGLVLAPADFPDFNLQGAPAPPLAADTAIHVGLGPGCTIPVPLPKHLLVKLTCTGGKATIRVELSRWDEVEDEVSGNRIQRTLDLLGDIARYMRNLVDAVAGRRGRL